ncbi:hypothetical protein [Candidatus Ichthyocystis hellenicum]|uniref:hypothetical protein n=1 Tax=Candidatus Ichthyocystis hellenicum TaxID=1561003 RepID=UPI000B84B0F2|nr:hypothetical protein [Candidatus Ichthyocystis hellenicum]
MNDTSAIDELSREIEALDEEVDSPSDDDTLHINDQVGDSDSVDDRPDATMEQHGESGVNTTTVTYISREEIARAFTEMNLLVSEPQLNGVTHYVNVIMNNTSAINELLRQIEALHEEVDSPYGYLVAYGRRSRNRNRCTNGYLHKITLLVLQPQSDLLSLYCLDL